MLSLGRRTPPLWWYPSLALIVGLLLGLGLSAIQSGDSGAGSIFVYEGDAEAARSFVTLAATAIASITTLTLTITVVTLQLASSQYSPRVLEHYLGDRGTHAVFSLFLLTFAFSIATLLNIRLPSDEPGAVGEVPGVAISVLVALVVLCLAALVFFVYRVTQSIRVETLLLRVRDRTIEALDDRDETVDDDRDGRDDEIPDPPDNARLIRSRRNGFYVAFDRDALERFEPPEQARIWMIVAPGDYVVAGSPVAVTDGFGDEDELADDIESWLRFDADRWIEADYSYGIRSMVDIALKALSPGINDPTSATMAIARIGEAMAEASSSHPRRRITIATGTEVYVAIRSWGSTLDQAVRQIAHYGCGDAFVVAALIRMLSSLTWARSAVDRTAEIRSAADGLREVVAATDLTDRDLDLIDGEFAGLDAALRGEIADEPGHAL